MHDSLFLSVCVWSRNLRVRPIAAKRVDLGRRKERISKGCTEAWNLRFRISTEEAGGWGNEACPNLVWISSDHDSRCMYESPLTQWEPSDSIRYYTINSKTRFSIVHWNSEQDKRHDRSLARFELFLCENPARRSIVREASSMCVDAIWDAPHVFSGWHTWEGYSHRKTDWSLVRQSGLPCSWLQKNVFEKRYDVFRSFSESEWQHITPASPFFIGYDGCHIWCWPELVQRVLNDWFGETSPYLRVSLVLYYYKLRKGYTHTEDPNSTTSGIVYCHMTIYSYPVCQQKLDVFPCFGIWAKCIDV